MCLHRNDDKKGRYRLSLPESRPEGCTGHPAKSSCQDKLEHSMQLRSLHEPSTRRDFEGTADGLYDRVHPMCSAPVPSYTSTTAPTRLPEVCMTTCSSTTAVSDTWCSGDALRSARLCAHASQAWDPQLTATVLTCHRQLCDLAKGPLVNVKNCHVADVSEC